MFKIGDIVCKKGEKKKGILNLDGYEIPITLISSERDGETGAIFAGIHCCEYNGIETAIQLSNELTPKDITGNLIILHTINISGFYKKIPFNIPEDNKNLNRVFPGKIDGTLSERIAYIISKEIYSKIDFLIDLHCGDLYEKTTPFVYFAGVGEKEIVEKSRIMGKMTELKYIVKSKAVSGAYNSASIQGIPAILIEMGGEGILDMEIVKKYKECVLKVLNKNVSIDCTQIEIEEVEYLEAKNRGYWYPQFEVGNKIKKGEIIGEIRDSLGEIIEIIYSKYEGVILYQTTSLGIDIGDSLIAYGKLK